MAGLHPEAWSDFFVATAGAAAALAGLVFVAVSINLSQILAYKGLPERALETLTMLLSVLIVSLLVLAPGLMTKTLGIALLVEGVLLSTGLFKFQLAIKSPEGENRAWRATRVSTSVAVGLPILIGALSLIRDSGGGLYWILGGVIAAFIGAVGNAWVLLVEIHR